MVFVSSLIFGIVGIAATWEVIRDTRPEAAKEASRTPGTGDYVSGLRQWRHSLWWIPSIVLIVSILFSGLNFTKELHYWVHRPQKPLLAIVFSPGQLSLTLGATGPYWNTRSFTMLTDWGRQIAPRTQLSNGGVRHDVAAVPAKIAFTPQLISKTPRYHPQLRKLWIPYWSFGLLFAGAILAVKMALRRPSSKSESQPTLPPTRS